MKVLNIFSKLFLFTLFLLAILFCTQRNEGPSQIIFINNKRDIYKQISDTGCYKICFPFLTIQGIPGIQAGEYEISNNETVFGFCVKLLFHKQFIRKITFAEGMCAHQIMQQIANCEYLTGTFETINEGDVFPDTYHYTRGISRQALINNMKRKMKNVLLSVQNKTKLNMNEIVILASIIEKEAGNLEEMPIISSVFHNRLSKNMRLQSCPTVIYALTQYQNCNIRTLTYEDTYVQNPYNTYRFHGLPPGPICCPGLNAIRAACNPMKTEYLYFVAQKNGAKNIFSKHWAEHQKHKKIQKQCSN